MLNKKEKKILIASLPNDWRQQGAAKFDRSINFVEKIAYGVTENLDVFEFLVDLALENRRSIERRQAEIKQRVMSLAH